MAKLLSGTRIYGNTSVDTFITVGSNVSISGANSSTSNTTGALVISTGGLGVVGNVYTGNLVITGTSNGITFVDGTTQVTSPAATASYANSAYAQANGASLYANGAFIQANAAFLQSNGAFIQANAAFIRANTPDAIANSAALYANSAFTQANAAYAQANSASGPILINSTYITSNVTIAANTNGLSVGPVNVANGIVVTVTGGQRWIVL